MNACHMPSNTPFDNEASTEYSLRPNRVGQDTTVREACWSTLPSLMFGSSGDVSKVKAIMDAVDEAAPAIGGRHGRY